MLSRRVRDSYRRLRDSRQGRSRDAHLQTHSRRLMRRLELPVPLDPAELCERLGEDRGTPIRLMPWELPVDGPFGMLISRPHEDAIVYQSHTTKAHQAHIILHEVGHIVAYDLAGGRPTEAGPHGCYSDRDERDAEVIASTIMRHAITLGRRAQRYGIDEPWQPSVYNSLVLTDGLT
ncbi:hypothetical protein ACFV4F_07895 [Kitasatospora sp. NPDC059722]|uniref:hypothetical protein n=2 Tax=unclassified Kitasatospora TaxID=2633591 RepID=UPI0036CBEFE3